MANSLDGLTVLGAFTSAGTAELPANSIGDSQIKTGVTGSKVDRTKLENTFKFWTNFDLAIGDTVATREEVVYVADRAGTITGFAASCNVTGTTGDADFDLRINGTTALSAVVNIDNTDANRLRTAGTLSTTTYAAGDHISISVTRNSSHDGTGPWAGVEVYEEIS